MLARIRKAQEEREGGFTLIELLVVIIIIGILAAVAIPVFLNQRNKGYDASAKSDLKGMQTAEETYLTDYNTYSSTVSDLQAEGFKETSGGSVTAWDAYANSDQSYCLEADSHSGKKWYLGSASGGPTNTSCATAKS